MTDSPQPPSGNLSPWTAIARLLTFRLTHEEFLQVDRRHLGYALGSTWIVGMGRWWDDPDAHLAQHLGLGSVAYAFVLAGLLRLLVWPFSPKGIDYRKILTFVAMTSPPGILYAFPVERFFDWQTAGQYNLWFLAVVATWRVALLFYFLKSLAQLRIAEAIVTALLPLTGIVASLFALNLHRVVFSLMGSIADNERSAHDAAHGILFLLTALSMFAAPVFLVSWIVLGGMASRRERELSARRRSTDET